MKPLFESLTASGSDLETPSLLIHPSNKLDLVKDLNLLLENKSLILGTGEDLNLPEKVYWLQEPSPLPKSFNSFTFNLEYSHQKNNYLNKVEEFLQPLQIPSRLMALILTTADELIMNAFFDAPVEGGILLFKNTPRSENIQSPKTIQLNIGLNQHEIAIGVTDQYGSVNPHSIVKHLKKTFTEENYQAPQHGTGAGVGLSLCVKRNTSLLIKVKPQVQSQFVAFFPRVNNFKKYLEKSQIIGLHIQNT